MNSISVRLLLAASVVLALFITITIYTIQSAVDIRSEQSQFARLQGQMYALLGVSDIDENGTVSIAVDDLPNPLMAQPMSGEYAEVRNSFEARAWASPSLTTALPSDPEGAIGEWRFNTEESPELGPLFVVRFAVEWQMNDGPAMPYQYVIASSSAKFNQQREEFNRNIWLAMLSMGGLMLMLMTLILAWGLRPLRKLSAQLREIEAGERDALPGRLPIELRPLTGSINTLIASERNRRKRYRNTLDDLAHSLKTPLSVLRNINTADNASHGEVSRQTDRMNEIVSYHIKRADAGSQRLLTPPLALAESVQRMVSTMKKVYAEQSIAFDVDIDPQTSARIESADWLEILGNLLDNACKYGASAVSISADTIEQITRITIDDNGPGFPADAGDSLLDRGTRADTHKEGQGIGLAVSHELIENYGGELTLNRSPGGGARVSIELPTWQ